jgi:hypothetical protein
VNQHLLGQINTFYTPFLKRCCAVTALPDKGLSLRPTPYTPFYQSPRVRACACARACPQSAGQEKGVKGVKGVGADNALTRIDHVNRGA